MGSAADWGRRKSKPSPRPSPTPSRGWDGFSCRLGKKKEQTIPTAVADAVAGVGWVQLQIGEEERANHPHGRRRRRRGGGMGSAADWGRRKSKPSPRPSPTPSRGWDGFSCRLGKKKEQTIPTAVA